MSVTSVSTDHFYCTRDSPRKLKRKLTEATERAAKVQKKLKYSNAKVRRLKTKVKSLSQIIADLKQNDMISAGCEEVLQQAYSGVPLEVMKRIVYQRSSVPSRASYPEELKSFALTLSFYSLKAYNYVRKTFQLALPHPSTLRTWYRGLNRQPGFTDEAFSALSLRVQEERIKSQRVVCSLMFDEMAIRKHVEWDGTKFVGYVDVGSGIDSDSVPVAGEALVMMAVSLNSNWKLPCGYFLIAGMSGEERANLVKQCLLKLHDIGVLVASVTCDGPSCNFSMMEKLGVKLNPPSITSYFPHPADPSLRVNIILDACHMLKLVRNCLASYCILIDSNGGKINWQYIKQLHILQQSEGLRLANRLKEAHIRWEKAKMKVNLAAQTISASVADALQFCAEHLHLPEFAGCEPTVKFLHIIDHLFDILNSRNPIARGYKSPLKPSNYNYWMPFLTDAKLYILGLTDQHGTPMYKTKRKTPFVGLLCTIESVVTIFNDFVCVENAPLKYLLTYKCSQDHLELFFGSVRAAGGCNNNPTVRQFTAVYKRMLMRHNVKGGLGNCVVRDDTSLLPCVEPNDTTVDSTCDSYDAAVARFYDLRNRQPLVDDHDYADVPNFCNISEYKHAAVAYISGFVVRMVRKRLSCAQCLLALERSDTAATMEVDIGTTFLEFKTHGGLVVPSRDVVVICEETEKCFQRLKAVLGDKLPQARRMQDVFATAVLNEVGNKVFENLTCHMFDSTPVSNHVFRLIKVIVQCYAKIRLHHLAKLKCAEITGVSVRKEFSKLILFKHQ